MGDYRLIGLVPHIATAGLGNWVIVWTEYEYGLGDFAELADPEIFFAHSTNNCASWSESDFLNTNATTDLGDDVSPEIATDRLGNGVVVWSSTENLAGSGTDTDIFVSTFVLDVGEGEGEGEPNVPGPFNY